MSPQSQQRAMAWFAMLLFGTTFRVAFSLSILDADVVARRSNALRVTRTYCEQCTTLEDFYRDNNLTFVLFHERDLVSVHNYKAAVISGFYEVCKDFRWTRISCGVVDIMEDREYATKYIDPKTAPAHILVKEGEPLPTKQEWVDDLLKKPGDKDAMLLTVQRQLGDEDWAAREISVEMTSDTALETLYKRHQVVIAVNLAADAGKRSSDAIELFKAAAQNLVLSKQITGFLPESASTAKGKGDKKKKNSKERRRVMFVALTRGSAIPQVKRGEVAAYVNGKLQVARANFPLSSLQKENGIEEALNSLKVIGIPAVEQVLKTMTKGKVHKKDSKEDL
eukprot:TRINITY_DN3874_c0_g1_i2.p1 TRINITY_DN3874_c0_g1~~TRINITY_DN3874_c0_g1_i2.p1  ORF type:complete len:337 (+),score=74.85 TRINITY_DN3874_c0_g1_i2:172-1182(+)